MVLQIKIITDVSFTGVEYQVNEELKKMNKETCELKNSYGSLQLKRYDIKNIKFTETTEGPTAYIIFEDNSDGH